MKKTARTTTSHHTLGKAMDVEKEVAFLAEDRVTTTAATTTSHQALGNAMDGDKGAAVLIGDRATTTSHQVLGTARDGEKEVAIFIGDRVTTTAMATTSRMVFGLAKPQRSRLRASLEGVYSLMDLHEEVVG